MDADKNTQEWLAQKLITQLEELTKIYRGLLDMVRKERELLVSADLDALIESNKSKEVILYKLKNLDSQRSRVAKELASLIGADSENPRLLDIAKYLGGDLADRLRNLHSALDVLIKRIAEVNRENEQYAQSALKTLNGAVNEIKDTLSGKKNYGQKGQLTTGAEAAGHIVSKKG